jgi:hypothetical protein
MSGQVADSDSILSVTPIEPFDVPTVHPNGHRTIRVVAYGIVVSKRRDWVVTTYATALVMAPDGTLLPLRAAMATGEEIFGTPVTL